MQIPLTPDIKNQKNKISGKSFGEFLLECIEQKDQPNDLFGICDSSFVTDMETGRMVDVIYKYDNIEALWKFLGDLYGEDIEVPIKNASPVIELGEYEEHLAQFREAFADEIFGMKMSRKDIRNHHAISHKHKFIFLKTTKTAGTSVEAYLQPLCVPEGHVFRARHC